METLASKKARIEQAVIDLMKTGKVSEADVRRVLWAMDLAKYDFVKYKPILKE